MLDVKQVAQGGPQGGGELGSAVLCDDCWDPKSAQCSPIPFAQLTVVVAAMRIASGQREILSMKVNRWVKPFNEGRGLPGSCGCD
jgi:hypothetical protein